MGVTGLGVSGLDLGCSGFCSGFLSRVGGVGLQVFEVEVNDLA